MRVPSLALAALLIAGPALADDKAACADGIGMIRMELDKTPAEPLLGKLKKALRVAEREQGEGEFDECLDAVGDARRALKP
ncbi:hypothetical protein PMNALOAF_4009 [Methylobacterium adhaesivum]|jgi:hypothetical protein|uniref:Histidine kinase n=1 Tax=Methylobacterium adhaesivum TaxID=333297 RepID=A0ABT8BIY2_9HYPH|nr:hypothetical protein [Methylobacterium adhaesivum]MDN3591470.1 hypothetical protein [Methylobacterium adhaesivum]GJD32732.1 hypothetical protein PMNALOAF_4009 [Methylobacterium adhaesivum]